MVLFLPLLFLLYSFLRNFKDFWWIAVGILLFLFTVLLSEIAPLVIFPLFYKFEPIEEGELKKKLMEMCEKVGLKISGVFSFNISKNTKKANAGFTGLGKSKRIILGDNLINNFTIDELRAVFAHEVGHYHFSHIWKLIVVGAISTFISLFIASFLYKKSLPFFGFNGIDDIAAIPLLFLFLFLYGLMTMPLSNAISRKFERSADKYALETMQGKKDFVSSMLKLKDINLADWDPNPVVEFFFYSHPSIKKRITMADEIYLD
jgi:STE24 endopeptidase